MHGTHKAVSTFGRASGHRDEYLGKKRTSMAAHRPIVCMQARLMCRWPAFVSGRRACAFKVPRMFTAVQRRCDRRWLWRCLEGACRALRRWRVQAAMAWARGGRWRAVTGRRMRRGRVDAPRWRDSRWSAGGLVMRWRVRGVHCIGRGNRQLRLRSVPGPRAGAALAPGAASDQPAVSSAEVPKRKRRVSHRCEPSAVKPCAAKRSR